MYKVKYFCNAISDGILYNARLLMRTETVKTADVDLLDLLDDFIHRFYWPGALETDGFFEIDFEKNDIEFIAEIYDDRDNLEDADGIWLSDWLAVHELGS